MKIIAVGDIFLKTKNNQNPFEEIETIFSEKDLLFGNLEVVLSETGKFKEKAVTLYENPNNVKFLVQSNFDVLNIANNHIFDRNIDGFKSTLSILDNNGLNYIGHNTSQNLILRVEGIKIGFLGYTVGKYKDKLINELDENKILNDIKKLKAKCDLIFISLHWGIENFFYPSPEQIELAHTLIDNGVSLILGHHPHVLQGIEEYNGGLIVYSLGNFNFDSVLSKSPTNKSMILKVEFDINGINGYDIIPIEIDDNFVPVPLDGHEKDELIYFMSKLSKKIQDGLITSDWWYGKICKNYINSNLKIYINRIKKNGVSPLIELTSWLFSPFCFKCYLSLLKKYLKFIK